MKTTATLSLLALLAAAPLLQVASQSLSDDIPDCATACTQTAAGNVGCKSDLSDTACLCSHLPGFFNSAFACASNNNNCTSGDLGSLNGALSSFCPAAPSNPANGSSGSASGTKSSVATTGSASGSAPHSSAGSTSPTTNNANHTPTSTGGAPSNPANTAAPTVATPTANAAAPTIPAPASPTLTPINLGTGVGGSLSGSSTLVVVQTVVLPQTTDNAAVGRGAGVLGGGVSGVLAVVGAMLVGGMVL